MSNSCRFPLRVVRVFSVVVPLLGALSFGARAIATDADVREFPAAARIEGSAKERGLTYGKLYREEIRDFLQQEILDAFVDKPASKEDLLKYAAACGEVVRRECPIVAEEFQAIAEGAGLTWEEVVLINLHEELYHRTSPARHEPPKHGHCTALAVAGTDAGNGHTYVGQTWDWMQSVAGKSRMTEWRREGAASTLAYGFPGMPVGAGVSSSGLALCWTSASLGKKGLPPRVGIPSYMLIAHLLAQDDMDTVIREVNKNKHAGWFTFVMADGNGRLVNIEGSPEGIAVEEAADRLVRVDYGSRRMTGTPAGQHPMFHARCQHMYDLLAETSGKNDLARLQSYFADPQCGIQVGKGTIDMMVFDTTAQTAHLSRGPEYNVSWRTFTIGTDQSNDMKDLAGTWTCTSAVNDGKPIPEEIVKELRLTLTAEGGYKTTRGDQVLFDSTCKLDPTQTPKHIDMIGTEGDNKGKAAQGIYSLEGDVLKICYRMPGGERPTAFESKPGSGATLIVWRRGK